MMGAKSGGPVLFVVEDEWLVRSMLVSELEDAGYHVVGFETADAAAIALDDVSPDLLLTDIRLPGRMDGWDLAEYARGRLRTLPVIYATGYSTEKARPVAGGRVFNKPYRMAKVIEEVKAMLDGGPGV